MRRCCTMVIQLLQREILAAQEMNDYFMKVAKELADNEAIFTLNNISQSYDALKAKNIEFENDFNHGKSTVTNNFETITQEQNEFYHSCDVETENTNHVLQGEIKEIIGENCAYQTELDDCEKQSADLLAKQNEFDIGEAKVNEETTELYDVLLQKNNEICELQAQFESPEDKTIMMREILELQEKLTKLEEVNQSLKEKDEELTENLVQLRAVSKKIYKSLEKKKSHAELIQKQIDANQQQLKQNFKSTKDSLMHFKKETEVVVEIVSLDNSTIQLVKLNMSDVKQHHVDIQNVQAMLAQVAIERETLPKKHNRVPSDFFETINMYYKPIEKVCKKLKAPHGNPIMPNGDELESLDSFVDEPIEENPETMVSSRKEAFEMEDVVNDETDVVVYEETEDVVNEETVDAVNDETEDVVNDETEDVVNDETEDVVNDEMEDVVNDETENVVNDETEDVVNDETEDVNDETEDVINDETEDVANDETFQKKAKCNGRNHVLLENEKIEPVPVNENSENKLSGMDAFLQVDANGPDALQESKSRCQGTKSDFSSIRFDCDDDQPV